jgi:hypothetical protein
MSKFCANGHQIEDSWDICPYCQRTGYAGSGSPLAKTRIETADLASGVAAGSPAATGRKTVLLSEKRKAPVVGWLVAMNGERKGEDFRLHGGQNIIGNTAGVEIEIKDDTISKNHASIRYTDGKFTLTDLDSTNGTFLNDGQSRIAREDLKDNDMIRVGDLTFKFKCL